MDEAVLESIIRYLQEREGYEFHKQIPAWQQHNNSWGHITQSLAQFGLIEIDKERGGIYLTEKGWLFESFQKINDERKLQSELLQSNKDAADATKSVSTATIGFYNHQKDYNCIQIWLTIAIMLSAIVSGAAATCTYYHTKEVDQKIEQGKSDLQLKVHQLDSTLQYEKIKRDAFEKSIKDSLKYP